MELTVENICKSFGAGNVLDGIDFSVGGGEICALLGENGAGKSTLMNIIGGIVPADRGTIRIDGTPVQFPTPAASLAAGIAFIHQELDLVSDLTVYENMFLPTFLRKGLFLDKEEMMRRCSEVFARVGIAIDPAQYVRDLDISYRQMVAISKALLSRASLIIMDEPTTSLTAPEIRSLFEVMRLLREQGIGMIYISHKLEEVMAICDRYAVLRDGHLVKEGSVADVSAGKLASFMVGHEMTMGKRHRKAAYGPTVLEVSGLSDSTHFRDAAFSLHRGEILGVTGLLGSGHNELFSTLFGIGGKDYTGTIRLNGKEVHPASPHEAQKLGLAYLPRDRQENAIVPHASVLDNAAMATLRRFCRSGLIDVQAEKRSFSRQIEDLRIRVSEVEHPITALSGGNQQKTVLARWLMTDPQVLILDNPTQGVDVGAKEEIYTIIEQLAEKGIAVVILSSEPQEILRVCDACIVMFHGRITAAVSGDEMNEQILMQYATGAQKETGV